MSEPSVKALALPAAPTPEQYPMFMLLADWMCFISKRRKTPSF